MKYTLIFSLTLLMLVSSCGSKKIPEGALVDLEYVSYLPNANSNNIEQLAIELDYPFLLEIQNNIFLVPEECIPPRAMKGIWQGRSLAGGRKGRALAGSDAGRTLGGGKDDRNIAGAENGRRLSGDDSGRNLGGDGSERNLAGDGNGRNFGGDGSGRNLAGDDNGRNLAGANDGRNLAGSQDGRNGAGGKDSRNLNGDFSDCTCYYAKGRNAIELFGFAHKSKMRFYNGKKFRRIVKNRIGVSYF